MKLTKWKNLRNAFVAIVFALALIGCSDVNSEPTSGNATQGTDSAGSDSGSGSGTETKGKIILHAQYPYIYIWESGMSRFDNKQSEMETEGNGWYHFEIESSSAMVIFKPNADDWNGQTDDLHATTGEWWYDGSELSESKPSGGQADTKLSAPTWVIATAASSSSIELSWNSVSGATEYLVYKSEYLSYSYASLLGSTALTSKTVTGLEADTTYYFWIKAANSTTTSDYSPYDYATTKTASSGGSSSGTTTTTLSAPTGLIAIAASSSSVELSWNSVSGATKYFIFQSEYSLSSTASVVSTVTSTSTTVTGLKANTKYYFWVKATNGTTTSSYSSYDYATTKAASSAQSRGTLKIINNSSYTIKNLTLYTNDYDIWSLSGIESLSCTVYKGTTEIVSNVYPGYYVEIGGKIYGGDSVKIYKTVVIQSGTTTTLTITDSDIISN